MNMPCTTGSEYCAGERERAREGGNAFCVKCVATAQELARTRVWGCGGSYLGLTPLPIRFTMHSPATPPQVFAIFLYQRWVYRVDKSRMNEFGQKFDEDAAGSSDQKEAKESKKIYLDICSYQHIFYRPLT